MMTSESSDQTEGKTSGFSKWAMVGLVALGAGGAGIWVGTQGQSVQWPDEKTKVAAAVEPTAKLDIAPAAPTESENLVRGVINPTSESTIASKMTARITAMPYSEGQSFPAGAVLARFDCSQIQAELRAAQAATAAYKKTYDTNVELDQYEAVGKNEVAVSKANLGKAEAEANAVSTQLADCEVRAPFAGKVVEQLSRAREIAASGQPLLKIQSGRDVEMELIVPSNWLTWLKPGASFAFKIDETGNVIRGRVKRFGASVDPVSKTIRVVGLVTERNGLVLAGMSGTATFDDPRAAQGTSAASATALETVNGKPAGT
jgi:membrane fusion protein, multidrug efflux system